MSASDWSVTRQAILGEMGETLLRFMRDAFFKRINAPVDQEALFLAMRLGWIAENHSKHWRLTPHGALIADSAREYCNWIDDKRQLPYGVTNAELAGKSVLDLGCGFGRHVFSASRVASLAAGLEAERTYLEMTSILGCLEGIDFSRTIVISGVGERMPFADSIFDVIICTRSLPYMDATLAIPEMARVLQVGGKIFLTVETFGRFIQEFLGGSQHSLGMRKRLGIAKHAINSLSANWTNKWLFQRNANRSTTELYVLLTTGRLLQIMEKAGLNLVARSPLNQLFVIERIR